MGDASLGEEGAFNLSATLSRRGDYWSAIGTIYRTAFTDFIFQLPTGEHREGLVVRQFQQADATFAGLDVEASVEVSTWQGGTVGTPTVCLTRFRQASTCRATTISRASRRLGSGSGWRLRTDRFPFTSTSCASSARRKRADLEFETDGYNDLRAYVGWDVQAGGLALSVYVQGKNLTDDEQRKHTSLVKDLVPEPGRTIEAGVRIRF